MILQCNYEEIRALRSGAHSWLECHPPEVVAIAAANPQRPDVEALLPCLDGDIAISTYAEQQALEGAISAVVQCLRAEMEVLVVETHPAHENAVAAYFDFAHAYAVLSRLRQMGGEMQALIEIVTGAPVTPEMAESFVFPD